MKKLTLILLALLIATPVLAVDYWGGPPQGTWERGEPGSTFQHYTFDTPVLSGPADDFQNPFGIPTFGFDGEFEYGQWECPIDMNPEGFVDGWHCINPDFGTIYLRIPNTEMVDGEKYIFIQMTSSKAPIDIQIDSFGYVPEYTCEPWPTGLPHIQWPDPAPYGGAWYTYNFGFVIRPNPQEEIIRIQVPFCTVIDQIVVDTICTGTVANEQRTLDQVKALFR